VERIRRNNETSWNLKKPYFISKDECFSLYNGDTISILPEINQKFDLIFADPPYFLSNNGLTIQSGQIVSVNKGNWDKSEGFEFINDFNRKWLSLVRDNMKDDATIWVSGTMHNIFSIGQILNELGFKIMNIITWEKTNPPPNFSCRYFTYSTEQIIWARKSEKVPHYFNYELMKQLNGDKQMKDVWKLPAIAPWEKSCGKHPTQKPLSVLTRLVLASTKPNAWILDPFTGSSTTGIAANLTNRRFLGIDQEKEFLTISKDRKLEIENPKTAATYRQKISGFNDKNELELFLDNEQKEANNIELDLTKKKKGSTQQQFGVMAGDVVN
jgi:site-specific DNA-methyltransferase (adenine-specific)